MVAVRSAHLNTAGEFALDEWIAGLGLPNPQSCERLAATWRYCEQQTQNHPDASLLLWRGLEMVEILSTLSMDNDSMRAALLFPLVDAGIVQEETLTEAFGNGIVALVHGVRDMDAIRQLKATQNDSMASEQVDNVRRMLLAMVEDFRCVVIKLAERIAHLREVKDAPEDERVLAAKECSNIYAPLANRLGIGQLKWELEDFCFRYLHPEEYKRIAKLLHERRIDREQFIDDFVAGLRAEMAKEGIRVEIYGRPKHIYSIWRKMQKKHLAFDELFDVRAVRIVAERLQDCYAALGIVHTHFRHLPAISSFASFRAEIGTLPVGSKMSLGIIRDGKPVTIDVTLEQSAQTQVASGNIYTGIEGAELSNTQVGNVKGVKVDSVKAGSAAARIGLKKGDVILGVNQQPIQNLGELRKILDSKPSVLALNIQRGDSQLYLLAQ